MKFARKLFVISRLVSRNLIFAYRILTSQLRTSPDFIIVGAQKAGTTSLYNYLIKHPQIMSAFRREVHFFDSNFNKGFFWYKAFFPTIVKKFFLKMLTKKDFITGESSPYYILHPHAAKRIHSILPHVKIIMLLRNPPDRSFSQYYHTLKSGVEKYSFNEAIKNEQKRISGEFQKIIQNENYRSPVFPAFAYLTRSIYIDQIKRWFELFPKDQILIIRSEDLFENPQRTLKQVFYFLGVPNWTKIKYKKFHSEAKGKMDTSTRKHLIEYFKPYNERLYDYLNRDFDWDK